MTVPTFQGEVQLAGWRESHNSGATVTFWLPCSDDLGPFRGLTAKKGGLAGHRFACVLVEIGDDETPVDKSPSTHKHDATRQANNLASHLHRAGYFRNPKLWDKLDTLDIYTQQQHKAYIEKQPCCGNLVMPGFNLACSGDVVLHHARTANNSGMGIKPPHWYGVPVCYSHHDIIHRQATHNERTAILEAAVQYTAGQAKAALKARLGIASLADLTLEQLNEFERNAHLQITSSY